MYMNLFPRVRDTRTLFRIGSNGVGRLEANLRLGENFSYACFTASYVFYLEVPFTLHYTLPTFI